MKNEDKAFENTFLFIERKRYCKPINRGQQRLLLNTGEESQEVFFAWHASSLLSCSSHSEGWFCH